MATILLISESAASVEPVKSVLVTAGHSVTFAAADTDVLEVSRSTRFDVALVDMERADLSGLVLETASKVVLFSGAPADVTRERVRESGAHGYVRKLGPERVREDLQHFIATASTTK
ncbi:MAG: response regulator [Myxococcaceae bacterium]|nr:response regulator [Myxococcaceae bacterium]